MVRGVALLIVPAASTLLSSQAKCGPQTKLSYSDAKDAASTPLYTDVAVSDGVCVPIAKESTVVKFCGPGKLVLSRMTCDQHDYKAITVEHDKASYTTQCEEISAAGSNVDGWLGSVSVSC